MNILINRYNLNNIIHEMFEDILNDAEKGNLYTDYLSNRTREMMSYIDRLTISESEETPMKMSKRRVIIDVLGGVASVKSCPDDVEVVIRDWDNIEDNLFSFHI